MGHRDGFERRGIYDQGPGGIYVDPNHHFVPTQVTEKTPTVFIGTGLSW